MAREKQNCLLQKTSFVSKMKTKNPLILLVFCNFCIHFLTITSAKGFPILFPSYDAAEIDFYEQFLSPLKVCSNAMLRCVANRRRFYVATPSFTLNAIISRAGETYLKEEGPKIKVLKGVRKGRHHDWRQEKF